MPDRDQIFMREALRLAAKGQGRTSPNPMVGAVVVAGDAIVGRGYHERAGGPHAEVNALRDAGEKAAGATLLSRWSRATTTGEPRPAPRLWPKAASAG